jgi:hypothetical protein
MIINAFPPTNYAINKNFYFLRDGLHGALPKPCSFTIWGGLGARKIKFVIYWSVSSRMFLSFLFHVNRWSNLHASVNTFGSLGV